MRRGLGTKVRTWPFFLLMYSKSELCSVRCYIKLFSPSQNETNCVHSWNFAPPWRGNTWSVKFDRVFFLTLLLGTGGEGTSGLARGDGLGK